MGLNYLLHRLFFIAMFVVCAISVVLFMETKVNALASESVVPIGALPTAVPIKGVCSIITGTTVSSEPTENKCFSGTASATVRTDAGWTWKCSGINGGTSSYCKVLLSVTNTIPGTTGNNSGVTNGNSAPTQTAEQIPVAVPVQTQDSESISETMKEQTTVSTVSTAAPAQTQAVEQSSSSASTSTTATSGSLIENNANNANNNTTTNTNINTNTNNNRSVSVDNNGSIAKDVQYQAKASPSIQRAETSAIVKAPVVIVAENLLKANNPKVSGTVGASLKVEKVEFRKKNNEKGNIVLNGKAESNALVTIFIFSIDPIVITVRADENGNWNYELDKDLSNGQHEAFVAVTDSAGKIVSKSEPIAFVKTAQAATMIPVSELTANQSPIEKSSQQYILMAIVIMSICLTISLVLIGFLSHNRNLDEGIN